MRISAEHFNMEKIAESGQCFRWKKLENGYWSILSGGRKLTAGQTEHDIILECTEEEFLSCWASYFDLETDYGKIEKEGHGFRDPFLEQALSFGTGIRILRQDFWETLVSFLISQNNNIPRIRHSIEILCENDCFPAPQELIGKDLTACRLGYRESYIRDAAAWMLENQKTEQKRELSDIMGVGPKVEACVRLYGLHEMNFCPMDTWMKRIVAENYSGNVPDWMHSRYAGYYHQVCFYYKRNMKKI